MTPSSSGPSSPLEWTLRRDGDASVFSLSGELDLSNVESLRVDMQRAIATDPRLLVFDLGELVFMDSSGLALLLEAALRAQAVELRDPLPSVRRLVELSGLEGTLPIADQAGTSLPASRTFPPVAESVPALRSFVREEAASLPAPLLADVTLVASELATNVVQYARTAFEVRLDLRAPDLVLEVTDTGEGHPQMGPEPAAGATHGRGLRIVDAIAQEWGVRAARPGPGKTVWVRLSF